MARLARVVAPGLPHLVTQQGNRRQRTFFEDGDYEAYLDFMADWCARQKVAIWAYCLMPNRVHLIAVPKSEEGLGRAIGEAHRRYTRHVNARKGWTGHLWQGRFASFPLDETHVLVAARYIELTPVRARATDRPDRYRWSSAKAHMTGRDDRLVTVAPLLEMAGKWGPFLRRGMTNDEHRTIRKHERTGRPLGDDRFVASLERSLGRTLKKQKPGPKPAA